MSLLDRIMVFIEKKLPSYMCVITIVLCLYYKQNLTRYIKNNDDLFLISILFVSVIMVLVGVLTIINIFLINSYPKTKALINYVIKYSGREALRYIKSSIISSLLAFLIVILLIKFSCLYNFIMLTIWLVLSVYAICTSIRLLIIEYYLLKEIIYILIKR